MKSFNNIIREYKLPMIVHATLKDGRNNNVELTTSNWDRFNTTTETNKLFKTILDDYNSKAKYQSHLKESWDWKNLITNNEYDTDFVVEYQMPDSTKRTRIPHHKINQDNPFYDSFENEDKEKLKRLLTKKVRVFITMVLPRYSFLVIRQGEGKKKSSRRPRKSAKRSRKSNKNSKKKQRKRMRRRRTKK